MGNLELVLRSPPARGLGPSAASGTSRLGRVSGRRRERGPEGGSAGDGRVDASGHGSRAQL